MAPELALKIAKESHRNLRRALLMLEACRAQTYVVQCGTSLGPAPSPVLSRLHAISIYLPVDSRSSSLEADTPIQLCDWEVYLHETAQKILQEQSPTRLLEVRGRLYELLTHCIPPDVILKVRRTIAWKNVGF